MDPQKLNQAVKIIKQVSNEIDDLARGIGEPTPVTLDDLEAKLRKAIKLINEHIRDTP